ncbi:MAG: GNAT family N-acetyltransferase [Anaerolineaceae bacterium]|nr:GNAT family N-acetyltransferase [Oscillospiraceae bacterium]MBQ6479798.1 GNAT family N-acetyltransferase [Anaerolineaceae bacterium]
MIFQPIEITDKLGQSVILRNAEEDDAEDLIRYLKIISGETRFLVREPEEITLTIEQEREFLRGKKESERELMLIATINGKHIGNCSFMQIGMNKRYAHRCSIGIALYQEYCGRGIGRQMLQAVLQKAGEAGYEQAELEVIAENERAISLYKQLGFSEYGVFPDNVKYKDGSYADAFWMMKKLC